VDHLVDADDFLLDYLAHRRLDDSSRGAGIGCLDLDLRWHDVWKLGQRNARHRQQAGDRHDDCDHDRQARAIDEKGGDHFGCAGWRMAGAIGSALTGWVGRTRWMPSTMT